MDAFSNEVIIWPSLKLKINDWLSVFESLRFSAYMSVDCDLAYHLSQKNGAILILRYAEPNFSSLKNKASLNRVIGIKIVISFPDF